jgi:molybdate transport system ATP-binding protein
MNGDALSVAVALEPTGAGSLLLDVAFEVPPGVTVLFGPSGAGKSRTLACIAGLVRPTRGRVALGREVWSDGAQWLPIHRRRVAYVFQSLALFPHLSAVDNVAYGLPDGLARDERRARAIALLARMHVEKLADRKPRTFSGGEAQRVALARAFAIDPRVVLLDEPFSALDAGVKSELLREVGSELARARVPTLFVTHQAEDAELLGDRVVFVEKGRVTKTADVAEARFR